jgi:two-component system LytT family sensor kinase
MTETQHDVPSTRWHWIAAIWLAYALFDASQTVLVMRAVGRDAWLVIFGTAFVSWLPWVLATPFIIRLARRYTINRVGIASTVGVHLATLVVVSLIASAWFATLQVLFNPWRYQQHPTFVEAWRTSFPYQVLPYLIVYGLIWAITLIVDARARMTRQTT